MNNKLFWGLMGTLIIGFVGYNSLSDNSDVKPIPPPPIVTQPVANPPESTYPQTNWVTVAAIFQLYEHTATLPGVRTLPAWQEFTPDYLLNLTARRQATIEWSHNQNHAGLKVIYIPDRHVDGEGEGNDRLVRESQAWVVNTILARATETNVIAIEASGADGALTWDRYMDTSVAAVNRYDSWMLGGQRMVRSQIEEGAIARAPLNCDVTLLRTPGLPPIIFGEDLPSHRLDEWLISLQDQGQIQGDDRIMIPILRQLRSEIALIRTLEYLRKHDGTTGIIIQGFAHSKDFSELASNYGINLEIAGQPN